MVFHKLVSEYVQPIMVIKNGANTYQRMIRDLQTEKTENTENSWNQQRDKQNTSDRRDKQNTSDRRNLEVFNREN